MNGFKERGARKKVRLDGRMRNERGWIDVKIKNLSDSGLMAECTAPPSRGHYIEIRRHNHVLIGVVAWSKDNRFGVRLADRTDMRALIDEDLELIRRTPGVIDAIATNSFPLRQGGSSRGFQTEPGTGKDDVGAAVYFTDEHAIGTFGLKLIEGSNFAPNEVTWTEEGSDAWAGTVIVSRAFAETLKKE